MQQRFSGACVAHVQRIAGLYHGVGYEIIFDQCGDGLGSDFGGNVARFEIAEQGVNQYAIADFYRYFGQIFVRAVHRIASLERRYLAPTHGFKQFSCLARRHELLAVFFVETALGKNFERARKIDIALFHHHFHARMFGIGSAKYGCALVRLVDGVFFGDAHGRQNAAIIRIEQGNVAAGFDQICASVVDGKGNGDRPEQAVGHFHPGANALPVGIGHEAIKRGEAAYAHHDKVALLPRTDGNLR